MLDARGSVGHGTDALLNPHTGTNPADFPVPECLDATGTEQGSRLQASFLQAPLPRDGGLTGSNEIYM